MALRLVHTSGTPLGEYDGLDTQFLTLLGGEVVTFASVAVSGSDLAAQDSYDGYLNPSGTQNRTVVTKTIAATSRPLMLADDGTSGYGTAFGVVVGGTVGKVSTGGAVLGPHTATGSGKVTLWATPGIFKVSLDACDTDASQGLQPTNTSLTQNAPLYVTSAGLLTPTSSRAAGGTTGTLCGRFLNFDDGGSLVSTPNRLVNGLAAPQQFSFATFYFNPAV